LRIDYESRNLQKLRNYTFMKIEKLRIHKPYRQRDKLLIHLLAIKNPHLPAVTNGLQVMFSENQH